MLQKYEEKSIAYNGKKLTEYEAGQQQRYIERQIRRWKRENAAMRAAGLDTSESAAKVHSWQEAQKDFLRQTGLKRQSDREQIGKLVEKLSRRDIITLDKAGEDFIQTLSYERISAHQGKLSNRAIRKWYMYHDKQIPALIDGSKPVEEQARQACSLRNEHRTQARDLMRDQEARRQLDQTDPNKSFEELLSEKMAQKGLSREEACRYIVDSATHTRKSVNRSLGLE